MKIVFLDIDGVLNTPSSKSRCGGYIGIDNDKVERLKKIIDKTKAEIVLISTWKKHWYKEERLKLSQDYIADYLDAKLAKYNLKATDKTVEKFEGQYLSRGEGIIEYIYRKNVENYIILDDCQFDYDGCNLTDKFIKINQSEGLSEKQVNVACEMLLHKSAETETSGKR